LSEANIAGAKLEADVLRRINYIRKNLIKNIESKKEQKLTYIQKSLYDICIKLISNPNSELSHSSNSNSFEFQIESENYLIIIRRNSISYENYSISLIDNSSKNIPIFIDMPFPPEFVKIIITKFDKEVQKRMNNRQLLKSNKVYNHLDDILKNIEKNYVK
jgi:hypothetical protein